MYIQMQHTACKSAHLKVHHGQGSIMQSLHRPLTGCCHAALMSPVLLLLYAAVLVMLLCCCPAAVLLLSCC
jgi:hypothetical protein